MRGPGPTPSQLQELLQLAMRVPDHGKLCPWRFLVIAGDARERMASLTADRRQQLEPDVSADALAKDRQRFLYAPVIVTVIASPTVPHKVPQHEQIASAAAVCMQLLNAAHAHGFAAQWLTAWAATDVQIMRALGLSASEQIIGFIHLGHSDQPAAERERPELASKLSYF